MNLTVNTSNNMNFSSWNRGVYWDIRRKINDAAAKKGLNPEKTILKHAFEYIENNSSGCDLILKDGNRIYDKNCHIKYFPSTDLNLSDEDTLFANIRLAAKYLRENGAINQNNYLGLTEDLGSDSSYNYVA